MVKQTPKVKQVGIYALAQDGVIRYIGQSKNINHRYDQHCSINQNQGTTKRQNWLRKVLESGIKPELIIIEDTTDCDAREIYWINHYRQQGLDLVNTADGGQTTSYIRRAKQNYPWAKTHSPVQYRLKSIKETINFFKRRDMTEKATKLEQKLVYLNRVIRGYGVHKMNMELWRRYGR